MSDEIRIGIIICDRYRACAGGKCLRALNNREGAFSIYEGKAVKLVGYTACGGCPGGNIEYAPEEMKKNGVDVIHLATGLVVGYPPCPRVTHFRDFIRAKYAGRIRSPRTTMRRTRHSGHGTLRDGLRSSNRHLRMKRPGCGTTDIRVVGGGMLELRVLVDNNTLIDRYFHGEPGVAYHLQDGRDGHSPAGPRLCSALPRAS